MLLTLQQYQDGTARNNARTEMMNVISGYISTALQLGTDYERAYYLANALRNSIIYNRSEKPQSIRFPLPPTGSSTVCAGLTKSYSYLCNAVGINTISMVGVNHAWNMVQLSGKWYYVDVTNRILFVSESELKNTSFARSHQNYTQTYPNPDDGLVMEGENQPKLYGCYDSRYYYYNNIFPESPASYDYASVPMQDRLEATSRKFKLNNLSNYYLSNDIVYVNMADLVSDFCLTNEYQNGDIISLTPLSLDNLKIKEGWGELKFIPTDKREKAIIMGGFPAPLEILNLLLVIYGLVQVVTVTLTEFRVPQMQQQFDLCGCVWCRRGKLLPLPKQHCTGEFCHFLDK